MWNIGMPELVIILVIALIIFGPRKLPELGRSLGKSIGEFKKASNELRNTLDEEIRVEEQKEQRVKTEAEQQSALDAANSMRDAITPEPAPGAAVGDAAQRDRQPHAHRHLRVAGGPHGAGAVPEQGGEVGLRARSRRRLGRRRCRRRIRRQDVVPRSPRRAAPPHHLGARLGGDRLRASPVVFYQQLFDFVMGPMQAMLPAGQTLIYTEPTEALDALRQDRGHCRACSIASPGVMAQVWLFVAPGLYSHEKKLAIPFVVLSSIVLHRRRRVRALRRLSAHVQVLRQLLERRRSPSCRASSRPSRST